MYDYYIPLMDLVALKMGVAPADITADILPQMREELFKLKENSVMIGDVVASSTALAVGEADILIGGGEWAVSVLSAEQPELDWVLPDQGGMLWSQSIAVFEQSKNKDLAIEFVKYIMSPKVRPDLLPLPASGECQQTQSQRSFDEQQRAALRWDEQEAFSQSHTDILFLTQSLTRRCSTFGLSSCSTDHEGTDIFSSTRIRVMSFEIPRLRQDKC